MREKPSFRTSSRERCAHALYLYTYIHIFSYTYVLIYTFTHIHYIHTNIYIYKYKCINIYIYMYVYIYIYIYICMNIYIYIYLYINIYTYRERERDLGHAREAVVQDQLAREVRARPDSGSRVGKGDNGSKNRHHERCRVPNHAVKGSVFVNFRSTGNLKRCQVARKVRARPQLGFGIQGSGFGV